MKLVLLILLCLVVTKVTNAQSPSVKDLRHILKYYLYKKYQRPDTCVGDVEHSEYKSKKPNVAGEYRFLFTLEDYKDKEVRARLLELLSNKWRDDEIDARLRDYEDTFPYTPNQRKEEAQRISKKRQQSYKKILDSLNNLHLEYIKDDLFNKRKVSRDILMMVGYLDMQEAIPILKDALKKPNNYDIEVVELVLARLLVEPYHTEVIKKITTFTVMEDAMNYQNRFEDLKYIGTQESYYAVSSWLYRTERDYPISHSDYSIPVAFNAVEFYAFLSNDLKKKLKNNMYDEKAMLNDIEITKQWIKENKGKLQFNRSWYR